MKGLDFYANRPDKAYSLVDCIFHAYYASDGSHRGVDQRPSFHPGVHHSDQTLITIPMCGSAMVETPGIRARSAPKPLDDLQIPPGNQLEALGRDRRGQFSISINQQRGLTPSTALRLAKYFGTSPDFGMFLSGCRGASCPHAQRAEAHGRVCRRRSSAAAAYRQYVGG